jgi:hypothetical protein
MGVWCVGGRGTCAIYGTCDSRTRVLAMHDAQCTAPRRVVEGHGRTWYGRGRGHEQAQAQQRESAGVGALAPRGAEHVCQSVEGGGQPV